LVTVGFALETDDLEDNAARKLAAKGLDLVVANSAREAGAGFGYDTNRVTLLGANGSREALPLMSKTETADAIWDCVAVRR
jgi:phosphopantothenoylcysteine decarboxylase/phosphopantothenate--cysteine ligase